MPRIQRGADAEAGSMNAPSEIGERLWRVSESVQQQNAESRIAIKLDRLRPRNQFLLRSDCALSSSFVA